MTSSNSLSVKIKRLVPAAKMPKYEHPGDAGADLASVVACTIPPQQWLAVPTGLSAEIPIGFELQVRPRSGLAFKKGVTVLNAPGTIDAGYRGEIKVILINHGSEPFEINPGDKIAQLVVASVVFGEFTEVTELDETARGSGGFGSTGMTAV
jgi:dUTP pyrophosphatase